MLLQKIVSRHINTVIELDKLNANFLPYLSVIWPEINDPNRKPIKTKLVCKETNSIGMSHSSIIIGTINVNIVTCAPSMTPMATAVKYTLI